MNTKVKNRLVKNNYEHSNFYFISFFFLAHISFDFFYLLNFFFFAFSPFNSFIVLICSFNFFNFLFFFIPFLLLYYFTALGTLETMHEVLASQCLDELPLQGKQAFEASGLNRKIFHRPITRSSHHKANIWVVRYVDYTSKYGLGFLLNTGSAGVYFNDSTKIVISPDGLVFQYSERRRKEKGSSALEHTIQTHLISQYPAELQKKVTLLRHFRNYLVDQQREGNFFFMIVLEFLSRMLVSVSIKFFFYIMS